MADRQVALQPPELRLLEDARDMAHAPLLVQAVAAGGDDAGRFLAAVLQTVQPQIGQVRGFGVVIDAEYAALVVEVIVVLCGVNDTGRSQPVLLESHYTADRGALNPIRPAASAILS